MAKRRALHYKARLKLIGKGVPRIVCLEVITSGSHWEVRDLFGQH
jgi:hypothetical protein